MFLCDIAPYETQPQHKIAAVRYMLDFPVLPFGDASLLWPLAVRKRTNILCPHNRAKDYYWRFQGISKSRPSGRQPDALPLSYGTEFCVALPTSTQPCPGTGPLYISLSTTANDRAVNPAFIPPREASRYTPYCLSLTITFCLRRAIIVAAFGNLFPSH